jgi:splicing factor 3B subunit 1
MPVLRVQYFFFFFNFYFIFFFFVGREVVANLAKAAGFATMIAALRPDVGHTDDYMRNTTANALAIVAGALGIRVCLN